jgi:hypothetical protein
MGYMAREREGQRFWEDDVVARRRGMWAVISYFTFGIVENISHPGFTYKH